MLILGGALATYLGIEEWKDKRNAKNLEEKDSENIDTDKLKEEVAGLKKEVEDLKKED